MRKILVVLGALIVGLSCDQTLTVEQEEEIPQGKPPNPPSFTQIIPISQEPDRGMHLIIYDNSDNENGFRVERKKYGGSFSSLVNLAANTETYDDWGLDVSVQYTYRIQAYNQYGASSWSEKSKSSSDLEVNSFYMTVSSDTYIEETNPRKNFNDYGYLQIAGKEGYWGGCAYSLLMFNLSNLQSYSKGIDSAILQLCENGGGNTSYPGELLIYAVPILDTWDAANVYWDSRPGILLSTRGQATHNPNSYSCIEIDVTNVVRDWYDNIRPNKGFLLFSGDDAYCSYYSKEGYSYGAAKLYVYYLW